MPPKKKAAPKAPSSHEVKVVEYKSTMMARTLWEPTCSCGWQDFRYFTKEQGEAAGQKHAKNPVS